MKSLLKTINNEYKSAYAHCVEISRGLRRSREMAQKCKDLDFAVDDSAGSIDRLKIGVYVLGELVRLRQLAMLVNSGRFAISDDSLRDLQIELNRLSELFRS